MNWARRSASSRPTLVRSVGGKAEELSKEVVDGVLRVVELAALRPGIVTVEVIGPHARAARRGAEDAERAERFEAVRVLERIPERRARDAARAVAVIVDRVAHEVDLALAELREKAAREFGGALAGARAIGRVLRNVDDVVKERRGDGVARIHRRAADANRPLGDAEAVRDVVTGVAGETRARLFENARERRILRDELS